MEFAKHPHRQTEEEWVAGVRGTGTGADHFIRVYFPNPRAALQVDSASDIWLPWGRRREQPGEWPEGGWAREESLSKTYWTRWGAVHMVVHPIRWMEKDRQRVSRWFDLDSAQGILCVVLEGAPGRPIYVVTRAAVGDYLTDVHNRVPVVA